MTLTTEQLKFMKDNDGCTSKFFTKEERQRAFDEVDAGIRLHLSSNDKFLTEAKQLLNESNKRFSIDRER
jgi:hypothetical protein